MKGSRACSQFKRKKQKPTVNKGEDAEDSVSDTEPVGRVEQVTTEKVRQASQEEGDKEVQVNLEIQAVDHGKKSSFVKFQPLVDTGVHKTLLNEADWKKLKEVEPSLQHKRCRVRFTPYGTTTGLQMIGQSKAILKNAAGGLVGTIVYIVKGNNQSLLGLKDALSLGIVTINKDGVDVRDNLKGVETVTVNMLSVQKKLENPVSKESGTQVVED